LGVFTNLWEWEAAYLINLDDLATITSQVVKIQQYRKYCRMKEAGRENQMMVKAPNWSE
jgi:hypothetical protein